MVLRRYISRIAVMGIMVFFLGVVSAASAELRFAVVDVQKAVAQSKAGKDARAVVLREKKRLEERFSTRKEKFEKNVAALRALQDEIRQKGAIWRAEERERKEADLRKRGRNIARDEDELKRMAQESRRDLQARERRLMGGLIKQLNDVVAVVAKEGKYDLILAKTPGVVLFHSKSVDITEQVIKLYNKKKK